MIGRVHSIETFGLVDGPGIRFVLFLHGCPLRCQFCHNPDTWGSSRYEERTAEDVYHQAMRYHTYWGSDGGVTVSGGEPLLQMDFLIELFKKLKLKNVHTCIDTSGGCFTRTGEWFKKFEELMKYTDLLLVDIKEINDDRHIALTTQSNKNILDMCQYLSSIHKPIWIRHVLVPQRTDYDEDLDSLYIFMQTLTNIQRVEVLPYHTLGIYKWKELGLDYPLEGIDPPTKERVENAKKRLHCDEYNEYKRT